MPYFAQGRLCDDPHFCRKGRGKNAAPEGTRRLEAREILPSA
jgi:hypothetical protein